MRTQFTDTVRILAPIATLLFATACADASTASVGIAEQQQSAAGESDPQAQPPPRPPACSKREDCAHKCPPGSKGCDCIPSPDGNKVCAPTCAQDADCPRIPGVDLVCHDGTCTPPSLPPRTTFCSSDGDCTGKCPSNSVGCSCTQSPDSRKVCAPSCGGDKDCPSGAGPKLICRQPVCVPEPAPPPQLRSCTSNADCAQAGPGASLRSACHSFADGMRCVPKCTADSDCPVPPGGLPVACERGVCAAPIR
jgi:hypothetical protein